jgi:diguanylate cyclase (GGDEF)-like protein
VTVVAICLVLMGMNAAIIAGGEQRLREVIRQAAITDSLTGLPNRHHFHEEYTESFYEAFAAKRPLALMLIDVDHFKTINDTHGHPAGDDKLRDVASSLQSAVRDGDMVARYGGDEFIAIARGADRKAALNLAERLRDAARTCGASVSIGVAVCPEDGASESALIEAADTALYRAKADGRNCVRTLAAA